MQDAKCKMQIERGAGQHRIFESCILHDVAAARRERGVSGPAGRWRSLALAVAMGGVARLPLHAHHSIAAVYDSSKPVTIEGVVSRFHFVNPHPYLIVT